MKKVLMFLIVTIGIMIPLQIKADSLTVGLSCPSTANAKANVSCTISAKGNNLSNIQGRYALTNATYKEFKFGSGWDIMPTVSNTGFLATRSSATSSNVTVGTLTITMPSSGSATIKLNNLNGGYSYKDSSGKIIAGDLDLVSSPTATIRVKSTINTLDNLTVSGGSINFDKNTTTYNVTVDSASTTINASKTDQYSILTGTGTKTLKYGKNTFNIVVTSESGAKKTYTINITRPDNRSSNNNLSSLKLSNGTIKFNKNTTTYNIDVEGNITKVKVDATLEDNKASFVKNYASREVSLKYGKNAIQIKVKAENDSEKTYTVNVTRKDDRSSNTNLSEITLSSGTITFDKNQTEYKIVVENDVEELKISATQEDTKSKLEYTEINKLAVGDNNINIKVTSESGSTKIYKLIVTRKEKNQELDSNNNLSSITIKDYELTFDKDTLNYNLKIKDEDKLEITVTTESEKAMATVVGNENLKNGSIIKVSVTSESGATKEYKINIEKEEKNESVSVQKKNDDSNTMLYIAIGVFAIGTISFIAAIAKKKKK